jgi:hypothetical protein
MTDHSSTTQPSDAEDTISRRVSQLLGQRARRWADQGGALLAKLADPKPTAPTPDFNQDHYPDPRALFRNQLPALSRQLFGPRLGSASQLVSKFIPLDAVEQWSDQLFDHAARFAAHISPLDEVLALANVNDAAALQQLTPSQQADLVEKIMNRNRMLVAAEGALTGWTGLLGAVVDLPAVLIVGLRSIYQIAHCYGVSLASVSGQQTVYRVLSSADLSLITEKQALMLSLTTLQQLIGQGDVAALQGLVGSATNGAYFQKLTQDLSQALNINIRPQLLSHAVPLAASATSAVYNVRLITTIGHMAQLAFADHSTAAVHALTQTAEPAAAAGSDLDQDPIDTAPAPLDVAVSPRPRPRRTAAHPIAAPTATDLVAVEPARKRTTRSKKPAVDDVEPETKTQH